MPKLQALTSSYFLFTSNTRSQNIYIRMYHLISVHNCGQWPLVTFDVVEKNQFIAWNCFFLFVDQFYVPNSQKNTFPRIWFGSWALLYTRSVVTLIDYKITTNSMQNVVFFYNIVRFQIIRFNLFNFYATGNKTIFIGMVQSAIICIHARWKEQTEKITNMMVNISTYLNWFSTHTHNR